MKISTKACQAAIGAVLKFLRAEVEFGDLLIFGGLLFIASGVWQIYRPAAPIVFGLGLFIVGYFGLPEDWIKLRIIQKKRDAQ